MHLESIELFEAQDPQLRRLRDQKYVHQPALLEQLPVDIPGIYSIGGGRQIGKTTLLKQWMLRLLKNGVPPVSIAFLSGELIQDFQSFLHILKSQLEEIPTGQLAYILVDEVTYIDGWDKAIKYAADAGFFDSAVVVLTGSDLALMKEARMRFPGRRGMADLVDFHLYPLSFRECVLLKERNLKLAEVLDESEPEQSLTDKLFLHFQSYLIHGGYLTAINNMAATSKISNATLFTYSDWIRGDMAKRGKQEPYLREIIQAIIKRYGSQVSWNALAKDLSIDHPKTVSDYVLLLESMDAVFVQSALLENKLTASAKTGRKLMFTDPFIFHALRAWIWPTQSPFEEQILPAMDDSELLSKLVEACVATHFRRYFPTYYIHAEGEVDVAYVRNERFWPIEVKWTQQLRSKDLKQIAKYKNGKIWSKTPRFGEINGVPSQPLPLMLFRLPNV